MKINLNELVKKADGKKIEAPSPSSEPVSASSETGLTITSKVPVASRSMADIYQQRQKLIYAIDVSISMDENMAGTETVEDFLWDVHAMQRISDRIAEAEAHAALQMQHELDMAADPDLGPEQFVTDQDEKWLAIAKMTVADQKVAILKYSLHREIYIPVNWSRRHTSDTEVLRTKLDLVKQMSKQMVQQRREKYPEADIIVTEFANSPSVVSSSADTQSIVDAISRMYAHGGTSIFQAVKYCMGICRKAPSPVKLNHVVLVTDGESHDAVNLPSLIPECKRLGVVVDFIWIADPGASLEGYTGRSEIKQLCDATGGEFIKVTSAEEFKTKFVEASTRALLPPPSV